MFEVNFDSPTLQFARIIGFIALLAAIIGTYFLYRQLLFDASHGIITYLQSGFSEESYVTKCLLTVDCMFKDQKYVSYVFISSSFMSRERFWYYLFSLSFVYFIMQNSKIILHEPRPTYVWDDIWKMGCELHFGSPSGHTLYSIFAPLCLFLDLFKPSQWSRETYP